MTAPTFRFDVLHATPEAIAARNAAERRPKNQHYETEVATVISVIERLTHRDRKAPATQERYAHHPDERVPLALLRHVHVIQRGYTDKWAQFQHALARRAGADARARGELWSPVLDAVAGARISTTSEPDDDSLDYQQAAEGEPDARTQFIRYIQAQTTVEGLMRLLRYEHTALIGLMARHARVETLRMMIDEVPTRPTAQARKLLGVLTCALADVPELPTEFVEAAERLVLAGYRRALAHGGEPSAVGAQDVVSRRESDVFEHAPLLRAITKQGRRYSAAMIEDAIAYLAEADRVRYREGGQTESHYRRWRAASTIKDIVRCLFDEDVQLTEAQLIALVRIPSVREYGYVVRELLASPTATRVVVDALFARDTDGWAPRYGADIWRGLCKRPEFVADAVFQQLAVELGDHDTLVTMTRHVRGALFWTAFQRIGERQPEAALRVLRNKPAGARDLDPAAVAELDWVKRGGRRPDFMFALLELGRRPAEGTACPAAPNEVVKLLNTSMRRLHSSSRAVQLCQRVVEAKEGLAGQLDPRVGERLVRLAGLALPHATPVAWGPVLELGTIPMAGEAAPVRVAAELQTVVPAALDAVAARYPDRLCSIVSTFAAAVEPYVSREMVLRALSAKDVNTRLLAGRAFERLRYKEAQVPLPAVVPEPAPATSVARALAAAEPAATNAPVAALAPLPTRCRTP